MSRLIAVLLSLFMLAAAPLHAADQSARKASPIVIHTVEGDFQSVREAVEMAIINRGLVVDHVSHIGDMLERTGKDIGATKQVYGKAQALQFCSASVSRGTMEADPKNIAYCPYIVFVYSLPDNPKKVYVGYRRPQALEPQASKASKASLAKVETLLQGIVQEAVSW